MKPAPTFPIEQSRELKDALMIKEVLESKDCDYVNIECFNVTDAERIASHLTDEENEKVGFQVTYRDKEPSTIKLRKFS